MGVKFGINHIAFAIPAFAIICAGLATDPGRFSHFAGIPFFYMLVMDNIIENIEKNIKALGKDSFEKKSCEFSQLGGVIPKC